MMRVARPRPIPARFLRPRALDGSYPFVGHLTVAEQLRAENTPNAG